MQLSASTDVERGIAVIALRGELDFVTAGIARRVIAGAIDDGHLEVALDLRALEFIDSSGLGLLVGALKLLRSKDGSLRLVCDLGRVLKRLRVCGFTKLFDIYPSRESMHEQTVKSQPLTSSDPPLAATDRLRPRNPTAIATASVELVVDQVGSTRSQTGRGEAISSP